MEERGRSEGPTRRGYPAPGTLVHRGRCARRGALAALGAIALLQRVRLHELEHPLKIEQRHREHLTRLLLERLLDHADCIEPEGPVTRVVLPNLGR